MRLIYFLLGVLNEMHLLPREVINAMVRLENLLRKQGINSRLDQREKMEPKTGKKREIEGEGENGEYGDEILKELIKELLRGARVHLITSYVVFVAIVVFCTLFIGLLSTAYIKLVFWGDLDGARNLYFPIIQMMREIHPSWVILLVVPLTLFYFPIYLFLLKAKKLGPFEKEDRIDNPPSKPSRKIP